MQTGTKEQSSPTALLTQSDPSPSSPTSGDSDSNLNRNFLALATYQILMRTGWIFKTESIIMPAVLDSVAGAGWVRGWLPLLNRFGHSLPPLLMAERMKVASLKRRILFLTSSLLASLFLLLSMLFAFADRLPSPWLAIAFLLIYSLFFMCIGVNTLAFNTLQGKLVPTTNRGRLLLVSNLGGAACAVGCAFALLPGWLEQDQPRFDLIFGFSGVLFSVAALSVLLLVEQADEHPPSASRIRHYFLEAWTIWRTDSNFRLLTFVAGFFGASVMLFPHYQNLGLHGIGLELKSLVWWVILQNLGTGLFSVPIGRIADRHGNRRVLLIALLGVAAAPPLAITLQWSSAFGAHLFPLVFVFVGLTPVVLRTIQNFALEVSPVEDHPRYLSTLALCMSLPMFCSPLIGLCIDFVGFAPVFFGVSVVVLLAWVLAFRLQEPRKNVSLMGLDSID